MRFLAYGENDLVTLNTKSGKGTSLGDERVKEREAGVQLTRRQLLLNYLYLTVYQ